MSKKSSSKNALTTGAERFNLYYENLYKDRWQELKTSMLEESRPVSLSNAIENASDYINEPYYMDMASILAASILPVKENDKVLDMCAAPGGKTLVLAIKLKGTGTLIANDRSSARRSRLNKVVETCLKPQFRTNIKITGHDSTQWSLHEKNVYDCILLDAPCSSERHVINDAQALSVWSATRPKRLAIQQFAMLAAALDAAAEGAYILYSTCSINPVENEMNIEKLDKKRKDLFEEVHIPNLEAILTNFDCKLSKDFNSLHVEKLSHGSIVMPDTSSSCGPLYFCLLRKKFTKVFSE